MNNLTLEVKDKEGIRIIEIDPNKKYILVMNTENAENLFNHFDNESTKELLEFLGSRYIFIAKDLTQFSLEEMQHFLKVLRREERKAKKHG